MVDLLYKLYNYSLFFPKQFKILRIDSVWRKSVQFISNWWMLIYFNYIKKTNIIGSNQLLVDRRKIIVSLTSFPARIEKVWMVVESLINQQQKPHKIILWLSKEQFSSIESLPQKLKEQRKRGLDIRLVDKDYRSHKKYLYAFREYPEDYVILVDDDILYPSNFISELLPGMVLH